MSWEENYQTWKDNPELAADLKAELDQLADNQEALEDAFYEPLSFGTAGMRGVLGVGINRMNIYTVRQATEGLATFMDTLDDETKQRGVAISYDSRHHSQEFAFDAARVLGAHGIPTFVFESLRPTPELSFTVRHLHTYAGIMITASHNPKQYNGYKIYGEDGAQMPPKESDMITKYIRQVKDIFGVKVADKDALIEDGTLKIIGDEVDKAYPGIHDPRLVAARVVGRPGLSGLVNATDVCFPSRPLGIGEDALEHIGHHVSSGLIHCLVSLGAEPLDVTVLGSD